MPINNGPDEGGDTVHSQFDEDLTKGMMEISVETVYFLARLRPLVYSYPSAGTVTGRGDVNI